VSARATSLRTPDRPASQLARDTTTMTLIARLRMHSSILPQKGVPPFRSKMSAQTLNLRATGLTAALYPEQFARDWFGPAQSQPPQEREPSITITTGARRKPLLHLCSDLARQRSGRQRRIHTTARLVLRPFNTIVSQAPSVHFFAKSLRILFHAFADKPIPTAGE
jgi:hypothetical protein